MIDLETRIKWKIGQVKTLFPLKGKGIYSLSVTDTGS